jgi:hypothetical protein
MKPSTHLIGTAELAGMLKTSPEKIHELVHRERLPFSWTTDLGICIRRADLPLWRHSVARAEAECRD